MVQFHFFCVKKANGGRFAGRDLSWIRFCDISDVGLGSKFGHLDSGSTLYFLFMKFPEKTESGYFIDTRVVYRSARNDDSRDDSL